MSETAEYRFEITGIDCANCAASLEAKIAGLEGISDVSLNFMKERLTYRCAHDKGTAMEKQIRELIAKEEPDAVLVSRGHTHHHDHDNEEDHDHHHEEDHCGCHEEHEHHHDHDHDGEGHCSCHDHHEEHHHHEEEAEETATYRFEITGLDCANCAASLEAKIRNLEGISNVSLNFLKNSLVYDCSHEEGSAMEERIRALISKEEPEAVLVSKGHSHHDHGHHENHAHEECHGHDHSSSAGSCRLRIENIDCADCAAHLERKIAQLDGISNVSLSFISSTLVFDSEDPVRAEQMIRELVAKEEPDAIVRTEEAEMHLEEASSKTDPNRIMIFRLALGAILFLAGLFTEGTVQIVLEILSYLVLGYDVLIKAVKGIGRGQVFDENFLMSIATIAAMYLKDFREAAGVMLFYQIGEYFQTRAVESSRKSIGELMDIRPEYASVKRGEEFRKVSPEEVRVKDIIRVIPGERIPLDGIIVKGASSLNTASLTGESKPRDVDEGDEVISGSVNETGVLEIEVTKEYGESTVARILDLVENQDSRKAEAEQFITKFSRYYTPAVVGSAIVVAVLAAFITKDINTGIYRACTFLVISCPCALVISVPLSFFAGIGGLSKKGILVKGANLIEPLSRTRTVVMDKTGTLTKGVFRVSKVLDSNNETETLMDAAYAEAHSTHPIAIGIRTAYADAIQEKELLEVRELAGRGIRAVRGSDTILAGNFKLMKENGISCNEIDSAGTQVYVAKNGTYEGCIILEDELKDDAKSAVKALQNMNVKCALVSGDNREITEAAGSALGMDEVYGECMPEDKVVRVKEFRNEGITVFIGDGVNDAPVLTSADIGIAMGALGSDAAIEAADVVIMDDKPTGAAMSISAAKRIIRVVNENIYGAITVKILTLILGAFGIANMWWAIFADTGVAMLCVMNSIRLLHITDRTN